jgi:UDP-N-acetylglucosamine 2-epimerase (non-hydrolysing)
MKRIAIIIGTRPEAIKLFPVYNVLLQSGKVNVSLISTGQHRQMLEQTLSIFGIKPDLELNVMTDNQTLPQLTARLTTALEEALTSVQPDCVVVQGDTTSAMTGALVSYYLNIPVAHVEAGLRTFNKHAPFPEEINRKIISQIAEYNFAPTHAAAQNLTAEKCSNVVVTGNTVIDALLYVRELVKSKDSFYHGRFPLIRQFEAVVLITAHRRENFSGGLSNICQAIKRLAIQHRNLLFIFPVHLNPKVRTQVFDILSGEANISLIDPVDYDEMVFLISVSKIIMSDSGGIQEEAPSLNIPVIILRETTERPEGISAGLNVLAGTSTENIVDTFNTIFARSPNVNKTPNPFGDGKAAERIADVLIKSLTATAI